MIDSRMIHFAVLDHRQKADAVRRLAATGMSDHGIASATMLSVEQIRRILGRSAGAISVNSSRLSQPQPSCRNCWITYLASKPLDAIFFCCHYRTLAYLLPGNEWEIVEQADPAEVKVLRHSLARQRRL